MLKQFSVTNFKGFKDKFSFRLDKPNSYAFNSDVISDGCITKGIIYGINGSGKSNIGQAIFDIIFHMTDNHKLKRNYSVYRNIESPLPYAEFEYVFSFLGASVKYTYRKTDVETLIYEEFSINDKVLIQYDFHTQVGFTKLDGSETLNHAITNDNPVSRIKYVFLNAILTENTENSVFKLFVDFVNRMLLFYSLDDRGYEGFQSGTQRITDGILDKGSLSEFEEFLRENEIDYKLKEVEVDGEKMIHCVYGHKSVDFFKIASPGTKSLVLFYYWYLRMREASFVFIDEFDAFYHFRLSENLVKRIRCIKNTQIFLSTHNTDLLNNDLLRPDCYFIIENNRILPLSERTDKELRQAHNIQKMFKAGAFDE